MPTFTLTEGDDISFPGPAGGDNDTVLGLGGNDVLYGLGGDDELIGGLGQDTLNGGANGSATGIDFASYRNATLGVEVYWDEMFRNTGEAAGDQFIDIEGIAGSSQRDIITGRDAAGDYLDGLNGNDDLFGLGGDDRLFGSDGMDALDGGEGNDLLVGGADNDTLLGGADNDELVGGLGGDIVNGGSGLQDLASYRFASAGVGVDLNNSAGNSGEAANDSYFNIEGVVGSGQSDNIRGLVGGNDLLFGLAGSDFLNGESGNDYIDASDGNDTILGGAGNDLISAGLGDDVIYEDRGKDVIYTGSGADEIIYASLSYTGKTSATRDKIADFQHRIDEINLRQIDAKVGVAGNNAFKFIGTQAFHDVKGELHIVKLNLAGSSHDKTIVEGDTNGDGRADFQIELTGLKNITETDFVL